MHAQRRPRRREIHDYVRDPEMRRDLRCARHRHDGHRLPHSLEVRPREVRKHRRHPRRIRQIVDRRYSAVVARGDYEPAPTKLEIEQPSELTLRLADEIPSGHADIRCAIGDELRNVLRANQDRLELAAERGDERSLSSRANLESGIAKELAHILGKPSLVWKRDSQHSVPVDTSISFLISTGGDTKKARPKMDGPKTPDCSGV